MPRKTEAGFIGSLIVVAILALQALERWSVVDTVLSWLRSKGAIGALLEGFLLSRIVPLVIAVTAIYLVFEGRKEKSNGEHGASLLPPQPVAKAEASIAESGNSSATGGNASVTQYFLDKRPPFVSSPPPPAPNEPNLTIVAIGGAAVFLKQQTWSRFDSPGPSRQLEVVFAEIKNARDRSRAVGPALGVKAEMIVMGAAGEAEFAPLPWFETEFNTVNFEFGETHFVLLAVNLAPGRLGDWRIAINHRGFGDTTPGIPKMDLDRSWWERDSENKVRLNLLHIKSGTAIFSAEGLYQWKEGRLKIRF